MEVAEVEEEWMGEMEEQEGWVEEVEEVKEGGWWVLELVGVCHQQADILVVPLGRRYVLGGHNITGASQENMGFRRKKN